MSIVVLKSLSTHLHGISETHQVEPYDFHNVPLISTYKTGSSPRFKWVHISISETENEDFILVKT